MTIKQKETPMKRIILAALVAFALLATACDDDGGTPVTVEDTEGGDICRVEHTHGRFYDVPFALGEVIVNQGHGTSSPGCGLVQVAVNVCRQSVDQTTYQCVNAQKSVQDPAVGQLIFAKMPGYVASAGWEVYDSIVDLNVGDACHEYHDLAHATGTSYWCD